MIFSRREFICNAALGAALPFTALLDSKVAPALPSPTWLLEHIADPELRIIDIRTAEQYRKGHIPGSLNLPMNLWAISKNGLLLELPEETDLRLLLGRMGLKPGSRVVVAGRTDTDFNRSDSTRLAWTCALAGIENAAVLDGGYNRWIREKLNLSTEPSEVSPVEFEGKMNLKPLASKQYVRSRLGKAIIADNRLPEDFFGIASKPGHIPGSVNLPAPWAFNSDGTFRNMDELRAMAEGVVGKDRSKEIIIYCGVGGFSCAWWFILTRILGYRNVKVYDGSIEDWTRAPAGPSNAYTWR